MSSVTEAALSNLSATKSGTEVVSSKPTSLDMEDFLTLLTAELQFQDPLNPTDNSQMIQQTAAFSQINALSDMAKSMETLSGYAMSINNMQALSFLGRGVSAEGNTVDYKGTPVDLNFTTSDEAAAFAVAIYDDGGNMIKSITTEGGSAGDQTFVWDGTDDDGNAVSEGTYSYQVAAVDSAGNSISATTYRQGTVTNVRYDNGSTYLTVDGKELSLSEVLKIYE